MSNCNDLLSIIGNTPLVQVKNIDTGKCELFLKMESKLPGGSLKDRSALFMINAAEKAGLIKPGYTLIEATSGNMAIGLALVGIQRGYKLIFVIHDKTSAEKAAIIKASGAKVIITRKNISRDHPEHQQNIARRLATEIPNSYYLDQYSNPANPLAHETTTGPEIWQQMEQKLDAVVCGAGTGGHFTGIGRFMRKNAPHVKMILADPIGSVLEPYFRTKELVPGNSWLVEGIGDDIILPNLDVNLISDAVAVSDTNALQTARKLMQQEGICCGMSSGTVIYAALQYCRQQTVPKRVVTMVYDSGDRYLSKIYNDAWLQERGIEI